MLYIRLFFVFSLLCLSNILLPIQSSTQSESRHKLTKVAPLYEAKIPEDKKNELLSRRSEQIKKVAIFTEVDIEEMELVFESSPEKAQDIVKYLQDPTYFPCDVDFRSAFFVGEPGSGKTVTAQAIAYKMAQKGWEYKIIPSTSFFREHRNQTAIQLRKELEAIESSSKPIVLIIDELHRLLENASSKNHDTDATSTALWTFLDKQKHNKKFFFIGTMNRANKLPKPFKDRMLSGYIPFPLINDSKTKIRLLRKNLTTTNTCLDKEVSDYFLDKELEKIGSCSGRNLKLISQTIIMMHKGKIEEKPVSIKKAAIASAINEYMQNKATMEYDVEDETDEERQERHHKENILLQQKHHAEQILLQKEAQDAQQRQFCLQQKLQLNLSQYQHILAHPFMSGLEGNSLATCQANINSIISEGEKNSVKK